MDLDHITKAINGDKESFEEIIRTNYKFIHRYIARKIPDKNSREDIIQEILIIIFMKLHTLNNPIAFKGWLIRIMSNCCNKWYSQYSNTAKAMDEEILMNLFI